MQNQSENGTEFDGGVTNQNGESYGYIPKVLRFDVARDESGEWHGRTLVRRRVGGMVKLDDTISDLDIVVKVLGWNEDTGEVMLEVRAPIVVECVLV